MGWLAAALSGILAGFSYPTVLAGRLLPNLGYLAFFCWIPLFQSLGKSKPGAAFRLSFIAAFFQYSLAIYWLYTAMNTFGNLSPFFSVLALMIMVVVLSAYFGLIFLLSQWVCLRMNLPTIWIRPFVWVGVEYLRGHLPMGGLPWSQIAYSQGGFLHFIQISDLFGVYVVTFLLVFFNEVGSLLVSRFLVNEKQNWLAPLLIAGVLLMATLGYGHYRLQSSKISPDKVFKVGVVQGNIPQDEKWQRGSAGKILRIFQEGTAELEAKGAELILWPEASFPLLLNYDQKQISYKLGTSHADLLFGAITHPSRFQGISSDEPYYNSGVLVDAKGEIADYYHKRHLVPFGEYVPWKDIFFFARKLTVEVGNLLPGEDFRPLDYREIKLGLLICYEDIFPEIARIMVGKGAGVLINISNDAWYGYSSAAFQHQVFSQFRSIETRRALVRATNTGLSSLIDRWGRVIWQGEMFQRQNFLTDLPTYSDRSLYVRIGDVFPVVCLLFIGIAVLVAMKKKRPLQS